MKKLFLLLLLVTGSAFGASEYGIQWTYGNNHQTSNTTWTPYTGTVVCNAIWFNVSNAGTSWVITVKSKESTPSILWSGTAAVGNFSVLALPVGIKILNGIDVTFSGTAGVADFWTTCR